MDLRRDLKLPLSLLALYSLQINWLVPEAYKHTAPQLHLTI